MFPIIGEVVKGTLNFSVGRVIIENAGHVNKLTKSETGSSTIVNNGYVKDPGNTEVATSPDNYVRLIENLPQLEAFRDAVNYGMTFEGLTVKLMANIDMSNKYWTPIGRNNRTLSNHRVDSSTDPIKGAKKDNFVQENWNAITNESNSKGPANVFRGTFDGNGKTINGLTNDGYVASAELFYKNSAGESGYMYGLFAITYDATILNLKMTNVNIVLTPQIGQGVGAIVGNARGNTYIEGCNVQGVVQGTYAVGGIIGYALLDDVASSTTDQFTPDIDRNKKVEIKNCVVDVDVLGQSRPKPDGTGIRAGERVGGLIGSANIFNVCLASNAARSSYIKGNKFKMTGNTVNGTITADIKAGGLFAVPVAIGTFWMETTTGTSGINNVLENGAEINISYNTVNATITAATHVGRFFNPTNKSSDIVTLETYSYLNEAIVGNTFNGTVSNYDEDITANYIGLN